MLKSLKSETNTKTLLFVQLRSKTTAERFNFYFLGDDSKKLAKKITKPTSWAQIFRRCCVERMTLRCVIASFASLRHLRRRWQTYDHVLSRQMYSQKEVLVFIFYLPPMMVCPFTTKKNEVMTLPTGDQCFDTNGHCVNGNAAHRIACLRLVTLSNSVGLWFSLAVLKDSPLL